MKETLRQCAKCGFEGPVKEYWTFFGPHHKEPALWLCDSCHHSNILTE